MTDRFVIQNLLAGAYICRRQCRNSKYKFALYKGEMDLISLVSVKQYNRIEDCVKEKNRRFVVSLKAIRSIHGKSLAKQLYKQSRLTIK